MIPILVRERYPQVANVANTNQLVAQRLTELGIRYSRGRKAVIDALTNADGPRSAAELHRDLAEAVPLSSLYRTLAVLTDADVVTMHHGSRGITRYELSEWLAGHHHHLVCLSCGTVDDITPPPALEADLESVVISLTVAGRFSPKGHSLEIEGLCSECA